MNRPIRWESLPEYGDHMTIEQFGKAVESGGFIDYDGYGQYATATQMSNVVVHPSSFVDDPPAALFTHVVWFNR